MDNQPGNAKAAAARLLLCFAVMLAVCGVFLLPLAYALAPILVGEKVGLVAALALTISGLFVMIRNSRRELMKMIAGAAMVGIAFDIVLVCVAQR